MVELAERMAVLADRLPGILKGDDRPRDNAERIVFAQMCFDTRRYAAAARLYAEALESDAGLVRDREAGHRYRAACAAALAAAGRGKDDPSPDDGQKVRLRGQALAWLKAELAAWADAVASGPPQTRFEAFHTLRGMESVTATSPASANPRPWRGFPRPNERSGRRSGPRSKP